MKKSVLLTLIICAMIIICSIVMFACDNEEPGAEVEIWKAQFEDAEGNIIYETTVEDGGTAVFEGDLPTKAATAKYTYSFTGWSPTLSNIHKDIVFKPLFKATQNQVLVTYLNDDDTPITTELVGYEDAAKYSGGAYKQSTAEKNYVFVGWDKDLSCVTEPITVKATYIAVDRLYTVYFVNNNGTPLETKYVKYHGNVEYTGDTPTKDPDGHYKYTFEAWDRSLEDITSDTLIRATYSHEDNLDYLQFTLSNDRTYYSVALKNGATYYKDCYIPGTYEDLPVKYVGSVGSARIENYYLGEGIEVITGFAFSSYAFDAKLTTITLPSTTKTLQANAFNRCTNLETVTLNNGLETIGGSAFASCTALKAIELPSTLISLGETAFKGTKIEEIIIPESVTTLYTYALSDMTYLKTATVNANVSTLSNGLCAHDTALTELNIGEHITTIGGYFINGCSRLTSLTIPNNVTSLAENSFKSSYLTAITIPSSVTAISTYAFSDSAYLVDVVYNANLTYIPAGMFSGCSRLKNIEIANNVTTIGDYCFSGCSSLVNITIPDNITNINQYAFKNCTNLFDVVLSENIAVIGAYAFKESTKAWFYFKATTTDGISLGSNWAGSTYQYVYSETQAEGAWHYKQDGSIEVWPATS